MTKTTYTWGIVSLLLMGNASGFFAQNTKLTESIHAYLQRAVENGYSGSVLVANKGDVVLKKGYGMADRESQRLQTTETVFSVGSITKQFTAAGILKLWSQQKINLDATLISFFPEAPQDKANITIHQLLTHTSGFPDAIGDDYENVNAAQFMQLAFSNPLENLPGAAYQYSNVGYSILGIIIEKVSGIGYEPFLREQLWLPSGMTKTGYLLPKHTPEDLAVGYSDGLRWGTALDHPWLADGPGWHLRANGGVLSTVEDMYKWYKALKNNTVLPKSATQKLFTPYNAEGPRGLSFYGYGWVIQDENGKQIIWHNGGNGVYNAYMGFDLANDVCMVISSNSNDKISDQMARQIQLILEGGGGMLEEKFIKRFNGEYQLPGGGKFSVRMDETNSLTIYTTDAEAFLLLGSDGTERKEEMDLVAQRTLQMLEGIKNGDFSLLAKYRGISVEAAQDRIRPYWEELQSARGRINGIERVAVVSRQKAGLTLAFIRVNFEKAPLYYMYVWRGEHIEDVQDMPIIDKVFECKDGQKTFYAANNDRTIIAENMLDGIPTLLIKHPKGDVKAVRVGDLNNLITQPTSTNIIAIEQEEEPYLDNPVTNAIFASINQRGADYFSKNSHNILQDAAFDFENDMQLLGVGERLEEAGKWKEGVALYQVYTQLFPRIVVAWNRLGKCLEATGDKTGARAAWRKSIALRPLNNPAADWLKQ